MIDEKKMYWDEDILRIKNEIERYKEEKQKDSIQENQYEQDVKKHG